MVLAGAVTNAGAVIIGSLIGLLVFKDIPKKINIVLMQGLGLCVLYVGIKGALSGGRIMVVILSVIAGGTAGSLLDLDGRLSRLGERLFCKFQKNHPAKSFAGAFIDSTLFVCVGAMAIVGSIQSGLNGNNEILFAKSLIDGVATLTMASVMGIGVCFSAICVLLYESILTLSAGFISAFLTTAVINEITCVGSLLMIGLGLNMVKATDIKVVNFLLAPFIPILICPLL